MLTEFHKARQRVKNTYVGFSLLALPWDFKGAIDNNI